MPRYSVEKNDPGYEAYHNARANGFKIHVYLNGKDMGNVTTADEEAGVIIRDKKDESGNYIMFNDEFASEELRGKVECRLIRTDLEE